MKTIYLAGGCFWGTQHFFDQFTGVVKTEVGYANGRTAHPSYEQVRYENTGHAETVKIEYDETVLGTEKLLFYYFLSIDPLSVNEDVVQKQKRRGAAPSLTEEIELSQFQGDEKGLALALRTLSANEIAILEHLEVVLVNAMQGIAYGSVLEAVLRQLLEQRTALKMRHIAKLHSLLPLRNLVVELLEDGDEFGDVFAAFPVDVLTLSGHLLFEDEEDFGVEFLFLLEHGVALLQGFVVADERLGVVGVVLADDHIDETAAFFAASADEDLVGWRDHHERNQADVLRDAAICLLAPANDLLLPHFQANVDVLLRAVLVLVKALQRHELLVVPDAQSIDAAAITAAETEKMDGIEHIRLSLTVAADETIQLWREVQLSLGDVLIIEYGKVCQSHFICKGTKKPLNKQF